MDKKKFVKIVIPILIVLLVVGVWFIKNREAVQTAAADIQSQETAGTPVAADELNDQEVAAPITAETQSDATAEAPVAADTLNDQKALESADAPTNVPAAASDPNFTLDAQKIDLQTLSAYKLPMIIDFGADSCIPCKEMAPVLKKLNTEMKGKAIIRFVDVWKNTNGADGFPVQVIPTQVLVAADGKPYVPSEAMASSGIRFSMYSTKDTNEHMFTVHQGGLTEEQMRLILKDMEGV